MEAEATQPPMAQAAIVNSKELFSVGFKLLHKGEGLLIWRKFVCRYSQERIVILRKWKAALLLRAASSYSTYSSCLIVKEKNNCLFFLWFCHSLFFVCSLHQFTLYFTKLLTFFKIVLSWHIMSHLLSSLLPLCFLNPFRLRLGVRTNKTCILLSNLKIHIYTLFCYFVSACPIRQH